MKFEVNINFKKIAWNKKKTDKTWCKLESVGNQLKFKRNSNVIESEHKSEEALMNYDENLMKFEENGNLKKIWLNLT